MSADQSEFDHLPRPSLTYDLYDQQRPLDPSGIVRAWSAVGGYAPALYSIHRATAHMWRDGLSVTLTGPMLKADGTRAKHTRCCQIDVDADQPPWLEALIEDAMLRLGDVRTPPAAVRDV